jgi:uncharacterized membrane protein YbhN (UPF0104 family)
MKEYFALMNFYSVAIWGLYALGVFIPFYAFGFQNQGMDFSSAVILLTVSSVAFVLPAPGAFGTYHSFMTFALVKVFGINPVTALSYSIITHELGAGVQVLGGLYYFIKSHLKISDFKSDETLTNEAKL